jgi:hypothetical protein
MRRALAGVGRALRWIEAGRKKDFFLKKEAKTFFRLSRTRRQARDSNEKVFWFFFSKKNPFLSDWYLIRCV